MSILELRSSSSNCQVYVKQNICAAHVAGVTDLIFKKEPAVKILFWMQGGPSDVKEWHQSGQINAWATDFQEFELKRSS